MRTLSEYRAILHKKGLYICLQEVWKRVCPFWRTHNLASIDHIRQQHTYQYLKRHYLPVIRNHSYQAASADAKQIIWICWLQGEKNAPVIIRKCIDSVRKYAATYEVKIITETNMLDFVSLPEHIIRKYHDRRITFTHFSDILRAALLTQHGGIWMDATTFLTGPLPVEIMQSSFFVFHTSMLATESPVLMSSWFIKSDKNNPVLLATLSLLYAYWQHHNHLKDYYLFHLCFSLAVSEHTQLRDLWRQTQYIPNVDAHTMQFRLFEPFSDTQWMAVTERSSIHKLTYKFNDSSLPARPDTFYRHIID